MLDVSTTPTLRYYINATELRNVIGPFLVFNKMYMGNKLQLDSKR
jgi:hypothetical protein